MTAKEFESKYKVSLNGIENPFEFSKNTNVFTNVAGKPKKILIEILKRFFMSWPSVLFLIVFLVVFLISIIVTVNSQYSATESISKIQLNLIGDKVGQATNSGSSFDSSIPPLYSNHYVKLGDTISQDLYRNTVNGYRDSKFFNGFFGDLFLKENTFKTINGEGYIDAYKLFKIDSAFIVFNYSNIPNNLTTEQYQELYKQALDANPQIFLNTILGTKTSGVDIWTQSWVGTWKAVRLAIIVATIQTIIGVAIGSYLGFHVGSQIDTIIMRIIDIFSAPPTLIWLLLFVSLFGTTDLTLGFALIFIGWVGSVGRTRLFIITVKDSEFIKASKSVGASKARLIYRHALPTIIGKIATGFVESIPSIILSISSLAFLGFFKAESDINLGQIISQAPSEAGLNIWVLLLPSLILLSISVSLHFIALGVHDALDPKVIRAK
ncbi:ABC transporter permease [Mycoplasma sp. CSL10166]|uniref:ABC transporter permease n=1 Tax=Mycoplasma sp. CSL10166 TaxID=2813825 RepID=UPI00197C48A2|nr:ABC transporter permease subunit [Mycoplasma sp. CSL10166]MBN4084183.1 ABC transporter permease [Mycoplasma sp. CSL10166]